MDTLLNILTGIILGVFGVIMTIKANKPRLIISGGDGGSSKDKQHWSITISNSPKFLGFPLDGASAQNVRAYIELMSSKELYAVYWSDQPNNKLENKISISPGQQQILKLFFWNKDTKGYYIVNETGEPISYFKINN